VEYKLPFSLQLYSNNYVDGPSELIASIHVTIATVNVRCPILQRQLHNDDVHFGIIFKQFFPHVT